MGGVVARILICEDDELYRQIAEVAFASSGHEIEFLENGFSVASKLTSGSFDLLVTDIVMPGKDGLEVIRELRAAGVTIPILVMSGGVATLRTPIMAAASALGADEIITKPFRPQLLRERAESLMHKHQASSFNRTA
jgi:DNA-binding response OmpR family regulator